MIRHVLYIRGILLSFMIFSTRVSIFISLIAFALLGNVVTAEKAFVITAYYNLLRYTMGLFFPQGLALVAETFVSIKRIQAFMLYDEKSKIPIADYMAAVDMPLKNVDAGTELTVINDDTNNNSPTIAGAGVQVRYSMFGYKIYMRCLV